MHDAVGAAFMSQFLRQSGLAGAVALLWFSLPGWLVLRALRWQRCYARAIALLIAPALGICTFGPFSLVVASWRYQRAELLGSWLIFNLAAWAAGLRWGRHPSAQTDNFPGGEVAGPTPARLGTVASLLLPILCGLFGVMVAQNLAPEAWHGGLYVNETLFDHSKVAIVDAIARGGFPVTNPFYAPGGKQVLLTYYFLWHFLASQLKVLLRVDGWPADVAMAGYTSFAAAGLLVSLAVRLSGRAAAGTLVILMASIGEIADPLLPALFPTFPNWGTTRALMLPLWLQGVWVPQHVMSALAVVLSILLLADLAEAPDPADPPAPSGVRAAAMGMFLAAAAGSSFWVGGVATTCAAPMIVLALWLTRLDRERWRAILKIAVWAIPIGLICFAPVLYPQIVSPKPRRQAVGFWVWPATVWPAVSATSGWLARLASALAQVVLFWVVYVPLTLGISVALGLPALIARSGDRVASSRAFRLLAGFCGAGFLLIAQFVRSRIVNDDLGWRAPIVSVILFSPWAAAALLELGPVNSLSQAWRPRSLFVRLRGVVVPLGWAGLTLGLVSCVLFWHMPLSRAVSVGNRALRRDLLLQQRAWQDVRRFAGPSERVQANPDGFVSIGVEPGQLTWALFSDRATAYGGLNGVRTFGYAYDPDQRKSQYEVLRRIFAGRPEPDDIRRMRRQLKIRVVLVNRIDGLWSSSALEQSHMYRVVLRRGAYRIYLAAH
jgi:hypothetical protein